MELVIRNARLRGQQGIWDIGVVAGRIALVAPSIREIGATEVDAQGNLVSPAYVNPHMHLDKCLLGEIMRPNVSQTIQEAIEITWEFKRHYTVEDIVSRATRVVRDAALSGTTVMRAFADVDTVGGLRPVEALLVLKERVRAIMDIQVVAFPQEGIIRNCGTAELMDRAMAMGCDIVGGLPWYERLDSEMREHMDICFRLAKKYNRDIHMLVDDTDNPNSRCLEYLAVRTLDEGYQGRVSASHCGALAAYDEVHASKVMSLVKEADISICSNPHISLVLAGRFDREPVRRGITRVKQLMQIGVNVMAGQDDVNDPYYPLGRADQAEVAAYLVHTAHLSYPDEIEAAFNMVTYHSARALRLPDYGVETGCKADLVVLAAPTIQQVLRLQRPPLWVIRGGRILARNQMTQELFPEIEVREVVT